MRDELATEYKVKDAKNENYPVFIFVLHDVIKFPINS